MTLGERGFVTIATGKIHYYKIAANLLESYRVHTDNPYPFAIIAESENQYTKLFDYSIIIDNPDRGYINKLRLFEYLPFEETIFIDADCLAYGDLNVWWTLFRDADDFSVFGSMYEPKDNKGWFLYDGMKEWKDKISFVPDFNGGVYYIRNTERARKVFDIARTCVSNYREYSFNGFPDPADEPVIALGMAVCGCKPIPTVHDSNRELLFYPIWNPKSVEMDISIPKAVFYHPDYEKGDLVRLIHWSAAKAKESVYKSQVWRLRHRESNKGITFVANQYMKVYDVIVRLKNIVRPSYNALRTFFNK